MVKQYEAKAHRARSAMNVGERTSGLFQEAPKLEVKFTETTQRNPNAADEVSIVLNKKRNAASTAAGESMLNSNAEYQSSQ